MATDAQETAVAQATTVTYTVQVREEHVFEPEGPVPVWRDFADISVPPRTKRRTVIEKALKEAQGLRPTAPSDDPLVVRVLGPEDAQPYRVSAVVRDPELKIEGA